MSARPRALALLTSGGKRSPSLLAACLLVAACGGKSASAPTGPAPSPGDPVPAPLAMEGQGEHHDHAAPGGHGYGGAGYGGAAYGGAAYGGAAYGGIAQRWQDPCGNPCAMIAEDPPTQDPPELTSYLPASSTTMGATGPDAATVYAVPLHDSPALGPAATPVTLVTTYEFADPYSDRMRATLAELAGRYDQDLRIVWKHFIVHKDRAQVAAVAACAANKQGKFQPFMNAMFAASVAPGGHRRWDLGAIVKVATAEGLDLGRFDADLRGKACRAEVIRDQQLFESLGQRAVPVSWINGKPLQGAQPADAFARVIDEELATAKAALARRGARLKDYYPNLVKKGKKAP